MKLKNDPYVLHPLVKIKKYLEHKQEYEKDKEIIEKYLIII